MSRVIKFKQSANSFGDKLGDVLKVILKVIVGFFYAIFGVVDDNSRGIAPFVAVLYFRNQVC